MISIRGTRFKRALRTTILVCAFVLMLLAVAPPAFALNTAVWSDAAPAAGALTLVKPTAPVVVADDTAAITKATVTMNGYPATFVNVDFFVGHSYYDEEAESDVWMVDDWTKARITGYFSANRILTGTNTIVTTVTSSKGVSTYSRTFTYGAVTMIALVSPPADSVIPASPADITVSLSSGATSFTSVMSLDGVVVPTTYTAATKTFKHTPAAALAAGTHTVSFSAVDSAGGSVSRTWKFRVSPPMSNGADCTACHTGYPASHPTADCAKCHDHGYSVVGGTHGGAVPTSAGCSGDGGLEQDDACHDLDHREEGVWGVWGSGPFACADCHSATYPGVAQHTDAETTAAHVSATTCNGTCHSMNLVAEHAKYPKTAAIKYQCTLCHAPDARQQVIDAVAAGNTECGACHEDGTGHEAVHLTTVDPACAGSGCHPGSSLTPIHINSDTTLTCDSCHESTDPDVVGAISAGDKSCAACHDAQPHPNLEANHAATMTNAVMGVFDNHDGQGPVDWDVQCSMCHANSQLLTIHANDCAACHGGSAPVDSLGTWNKSCQQGACHPTVEHAQADPAHTAIASQNCETCHEQNWDVHYTTCEWCHDPAGATAPTTTSDLKANYVGSAPINFSAGGIHYTRYKLDGGAAVPGSSLTVQGPAVGSVSHTIEYWSVSDAGVEELPHKTGLFTISADTLAPTTTSNALATYVGPATITLSVTDNNSAPVPLTYYKLDGGAQTAGRTIAVAQPSSGAQAHTLEFWSVDAAGNVELPHKTKSFTVTADTAAPTTTHSAPTYDRTTTNLYVSFGATDPAPSSGVAGTYRNYNGGPFVLGTWLTLPSTQGLHTFQYWSIDRAGNMEAIKTHTVIKDWTAPTTTSNAQATYVGSAAIRLTATDSGPAGTDTTYYKLDSDPQTAGTDVTTALTGTHTLKFWSVDKAGNVEAQKTVTFTVSGGGTDTTPPVTTSDALTAYPSAAVINLTATDIGGTGVANTFYRLDGGAQTTGTVVPVAAPTSGVANHTLEFWSVDKAGNVETPRKTASFTVTNTTATIRLVWGDNDTSGYIPIGDSWAAWTVRNGGETGPVVASGSSSAGSGWDGIDDVLVPVQAAPYWVRIDWWDADWGAEGPTIHSAVYVVVPDFITIVRY